jgi:hypothetical protein
VLNTSSENLFKFILAGDNFVFQIGDLQIGEKGVTAGVASDLETCVGEVAQLW